MLVNSVYYKVVSSTDNLCKHAGPRAGQTKLWAYSGSKLFDTLIEETLARPHILQSDLGLHCLAMSRKQDTMLMLINCRLLII